jgi:GYF domain 2
MQKWHYEKDGQRIGPIEFEHIYKLIKDGAITRDTAVWREGFTEWKEAFATELKDSFDQTAPPPLPSAYVNNTIIWILAFAPAIGEVLKGFIEGVTNGYLQAQNLWIVVVVLNVALAELDAKKLIAAGVEASKFRSMTWIVPVYLFQRAKALKHEMYYFIVWIVCFIVVLAGF